MSDERRRKSPKETSKSSHSPRKSRIRVNLREQRIQRNFSVQDISIRTNIPLPFLEALETGIVPPELRGRKLAKYKSRYLSFLGFPTDAKLRFKMTEPKYGRTKSRSARTISQKIEQPSTVKAMLTGIALAGAMIGLLKITSQVLEQDPLISLSAATASTLPKEEGHPASSTMTTAIDTPKELSAQSSTVASIAPLLTEDALTTEYIQVEEDFKNALTIEASDRTRVEVHCDGKILASQRLEASERVTCKYNQEASIFVRDISRIKIENNERTIHPMGPLSTARKLVFKN